MRWEELEDELEVLETEREYDGYFCSIKDAVIIVILGSLCDLQSVKKIHEWATTEYIRTFLAETFGIKRIPCYWRLLSLLAIIRPELKCIGALHTRFETNKGVTEEWHYYISSKALRAEELLHHARTEWSVESMHWLLDVHFDEDRCRVQSKNVQQNLNMLHKFALRARCKLRKELRVPCRLQAAGPKSAPQFRVNLLFKPIYYCGLMPSFESIG